MGVTTIKMTASQTITLNESDGVMGLSVIADPTSSSFDFLGNYTFQGSTGETVTLANGLGVNLVALSPTSPLSDITITWVSGTVNVIIVV